MKIAYQGVPGCNSESALITYYPDHTHLPCASFLELVRACENKSVDAILMPIENTIGGSIKLTYNLIVEASLHITAEINFPIHYCVLVHPFTSRKKIKYAMSHPEALLQCAKYIERNGWRTKDYRDTAESAKLISRRKSLTIAAIAPPRCALLYQLQVLDNNIEDDPTNTTRFFLLQREPAHGNADKITVTFRLPHNQGSLYSALQIIAEHGYNMTKIESCPIPNEPYHYEFVVDLDVHGKEWRKLLETLQNKFGTIKLLGAYKTGTKN